MKLLFSPFLSHRAPVARALVGASALLILSVGAPGARGQESLIVPEEAALGTGVTVPTLETPEQRADRADLARLLRDRENWRSFRGATAGADNAGETQNTAVVLAKYQGWLEAHPDLHPAVTAEAGVVISRLQRQSGDAAGATQTLSVLWEQTKESDGALSVRAEQARALLDGARGDDRAAAGAAAQTLLEPLLERAIATSVQRGGDRFVPARELLQRYANALAGQGQGLELASFARRVLVGSPAHLAGGLFQNENAWLYRVTIETLVADARPAAKAQVLGWAKLNWVERPFDAKSVGDASKLVAQALLVQPNGSELLEQWAKAQKDPTAPNPLAEVALPATEAGALARALEQLGQTRATQQERVSVLLWMGRDRAAMEAALAGADKIAPEASGERTQVMREVARVFKAHDLGIKGANAYLSWAAKPEGASPLEAFMAAVPATGATNVNAGGAP